MSQRQVHRFIYRTYRLVNNSVTKRFVLNWIYGRWFLCFASSRGSQCDEFLFLSLRLFVDLFVRLVMSLHSYVTLQLKECCDSGMLFRIWYMWALYSLTNCVWGAEKTIFSNSYLIELEVEVLGAVTVWPSEWTVVEYTNTGIRILNHFRYGII